MSDAYSLTRRLTVRVLALVALGWLAAATSALWVLDHETSETLDRALRRQAEFVVRLTATGLAVPDRPGQGGTIAVIAMDGGAAIPARPWPAGPPGRSVWTGNGWAVARASLPDGRSVELGERLDQRRKELGESVRGLILVMLPVALGLMWVIRRTLGQAVRPIRQLSQVLTDRNAADLAALDASGLPAELAPVAQGMNHYLARIRGLVAAERDFTAHAAHELRTPVAAARAEAQLLAAQPAVAAQAGRIVTALDRITSLTERLLQLARAEAGVGLARAPVDLTRLLPLVLADLPPVPDRPLRYDDGDLDEAIVHGDPDGLAILIRNLAQNAMIHGTGAVRVSLGPGPRLTLANPVDAEARFRHERLGRGPRSPGTGLGLTIAGRLAEQSGARLTTAIAGTSAVVTLDWAAAGD